MSNQSQSDSVIRVSVEDHIALLTLNRPDTMNAMNMQMAVDLRDRLLELNHRQSVYVLVIRGAGESAFSVGADLKERREMSEEEKWEHGVRLKEAFNACEELNVPVIAAIHGYCLGGGAELAVACDLRVASRDATLGFPEAGLAAFPGAGGAVRLPRLIGLGRARELLYTAKKISGSQAEEYGLVQHAVAVDAVEDQAMKTARRIASNGPLAVQALKRLLNVVPHTSQDAAMELSDALRKPLNATDDYQEALEAFREGREPEFRGT